MSVTPDHADELLARLLSILSINAINSKESTRTLTRAILFVALNDTSALPLQYDRISADERIISTLKMVDRVMKELEQ